ncbi:NAD(P)/FAD-dependent oxidoreductase [Brachyspira hyodysenteriae]|uniref:NAD(P)/FAD-dependent oxidoreductase n=1 Tax=Brachyspira hyodysenteriae TaxID=159 RepID=UPI00063D94C1|nr:NAD(P)/FAD-dependent oxidoreductase [Brachyspira hyodysenteriae]KLI23080.1 hypothetical protein SU43_07095 [Brachyspira hyodysenteriae]TVL57168.1 hypothetical protein A9X86_04650 [Brachyspira hyodysenteriae]TVL59635.1 hypothetical protein A9X83_04945 [Brachyspira hyodysenteriae]TVL83019.1 hypothetical protein A9X82_00010 [Brachyspira hyodysenteriae]
MNNKKVVIIGAGPAGLTAAYELLKHDKNLDVNIYEETNVIGGISQTVNNNGNRMDIGGHRFFSKSDKVMDFWVNIMPEESEKIDPDKTDRVMLVRNRLSRIFFLKKLFNYPITLSKDLIFNLGFFRCINIGFSYIYSSIFPYKKVDSLEKFYINRFGRKLYNLFFKDYTEKVWGVKPSELSPDWGAQRVKGLSVWKTVINALKTKNKSTDIKQKDLETSLIEKFLYPKYGPGQLWETVAKEIESMGGKIHFNKKIEKIKIENNKAVFIGTKYNEVIDNIDYLISTMPVKDLIYSISLMNEVPDEVKITASKLQYRDFITVGLLLKDISLHNKNGIVKDNWIYIQEPYVKVARLQLFNNWSPYMVSDKNLHYLGMEYMCFEDDELWSMSDNDFIKFAVEEMKSLKLIKDEYIVSSNIVKIKKAYPSYTGSYNEFYKIKDYADKIDNLFLIGRNGMHRYNNMDHSMLSAMEAVNCIINNSSDKSSIWNINIEKEYHEEKK